MLDVDGVGQADDAIRLSCQLEHPAYDCCYLLLARQHQALLLTLDKKLKRLAEKLSNAQKVNFAFDLISPANRF